MGEERTLIRGGQVYDPIRSTIAPGDVHLSGPVVAEPFPPDRADVVVDASGLLVTPGWVDLHTHIFRGQDLAVDPADLGPRTGVTTMIDAGSSGGHLYGAFREVLAGTQAPRVRAFLNIASIGTTSILLAGELRQSGYVDEDTCLRTLRAHPEILGVKVRASANVGGEGTTAALRRARRVADAAGLPLMVHVGPPPVGYREVLAELRAGDIVTHCFSPHTDVPVADASDGDRLLEAAVSARDRGVLFDVGHGGGSFDAARTAAALRAGFRPDTISSDVHAYSGHRAGGDIAGSASTGRAEEDNLMRDGLPLVVDKMLALGLSLQDALHRVTLAPAVAAGLASSGVGSLTVGGPADVAIVRLVQGPVTLYDTRGVAFAGTCRVRPVMTFQSGSKVFHAKDR